MIINVYDSLLYLAKFNPEFLSLTLTASQMTK